MHLQRFILFFIGFLGLTLPCFASIQLPSANCDTLITNAGQVLLVHIEPGTNDSIVRFTYCGESGLKPEEQPRSNFKQIKRSVAPAGVVASTDLPEGSEAVELIIDGQKPLPDPEKITTWTKLGALGGFGSVFMVLFAFAFNPLMIMLMLPMSIVGMVFSIKVLKRTKNRPNFGKQRRLSKWSLAMCFGWLGLSILYILVAVIFFLLFFV